jgi:SSS family solute:Na+ symporter
MNIDYVTLGVFIGLFVVFVLIGFLASRFRRGDLSSLNEWGLGGRRFGALLVWFLLGADLFTAYTFIAVPSGFLAKGSLYWFAVPYVGTSFGVALLTMPRLWTVSRNRGYVTAPDFIKGRMNSRSLAIAIAVTGIAAELPYIALQIVGLETVLTIMLYGLNLAASAHEITEIALIVAFIVLAAYTITSGLRGAVLTGVFKDILILLTVAVVIVVVPLTTGGFAHAFQQANLLSPTVDKALNGASAAIPYLDLPSSKLAAAFLSLAIGSSLALYLYPHAINGALSSQDRDKLKLGTAILPIYGIGLALIALFGVLVYSVPSALGIVLHFKNGALTVPALIASTMPDWFVGIAFLGIFVGGLVPAAIMAIAVANLFVRNIVGEFAKLKPRTETTLAKIISTVFKFIALAFVFVVPATYAIQLQLLGGVLIAQTLPAVFLPLYTNKLEPRSTLVGWGLGVLSGILMELYANKFGPLVSSVYNTTLGPIYIALLALGINLLITAVGTGVAYGAGWRPKEGVKNEELVSLR